MEENKKKIVIVGGGIAGLSAGIYGKRFEMPNFLQLFPPLHGR